MTAGMTLTVLVPSEVFAVARDVTRVVAQTHAGSFGLLPRRLDCVAALTPGILVYETEAEGESYVAVDTGVLVKVGRDVRISVRRAIRGDDLAHLRAAVEREFLTLSEEEQSVRVVMAKLEMGFLRRFMDLAHD